MNKIIFIIGILFTSISSAAQTSLIYGSIVEFGSQAPLPMCRIIVNNSLEYFSDTAGYFKINAKGIKIIKMDFAFIGFYGLTLESIPKEDSIKIEIALVSITVGDDHFKTIKENGNVEKKIDKERSREKELERMDQSSRAYIIYKGNQINGKNGLIKFENCR